MFSRDLFCLMVCISIGENQGCTLVYISRVVTLYWMTSLTSHVIAVVVVETWRLGPLEKGFPSKR